MRDRFHSPPVLRGARGGRGPPRSFPRIVKSVLGGQRVSNLGDDQIEPPWIVDGHLRERLAVQLDLRL